MGAVAWTATRTLVRFLRATVADLDAARQLPTANVAQIAATALRPHFGPVKGTLPIGYRKPAIAARAVARSISDAISSDLAE